MPMPEELGFFRRSFEKRRFRFLCGLFPSKIPLKVLDAGSGSGWLSENLLTKGFSVTALDLGLDSLKRSKKRLGSKVSYALGDAVKLPFRDESFDAVVASEVLEHVESPAGVISELVRVLRKNGLLVVCSPYNEKIEYTLCIHCNEKTPVNAHLHSFNKDLIHSTFSQSGLEIRNIILFGSRPVERFGFAGFTSGLPYLFWRFFDILACKLLGRQSYFALKAVKRD